MNIAWLKEFTTHFYAVRNIKFFYNLIIQIDSRQTCTATSELDWILFQQRANLVESWRIFWIGYILTACQGKNVFCRYMFIRHLLSSRVKVLNFLREISLLRGKDVNLEGSCESDRELNGNVLLTRMKTSSIAAAGLLTELVERRSLTIEICTYWLLTVLYLYYQSTYPSTYTVN